MNRYYEHYQQTLGKHPRDKYFQYVLSCFGGKSLKILEIGCSRRLEIDGNNPAKESDGWSTLFWCEYIKKFGGSLIVNDISEEALNNCKEIVSDFIGKIDIQFKLGDGIDLITEDLDLLFLDGSDSVIECLNQFKKANRNKTSIFCDDAHVKATLVMNNYKDCIVWDVNQRGHLMCFYPSQSLKIPTPKQDFTNEVYETNKLSIIEKNGEKIIPVIFYGPNRHKDVLEYNKKVFNYFGINMNYVPCPFPSISHGAAIDSFIDHTLNVADYWIFFENDSCPTRKDIIDLAYDKVKDKMTVFGGAHQSNHKKGPNGEFNHPYVGPSFHCISKELYLKLGKPKYDCSVNPHSDTAEQITYEAERLGYNVCLIWPRSVEGLSEKDCIDNGIDLKHQKSDLGNGFKYGFGTVYSDVYIHQMCASVESHSKRFIDKCKQIISENEPDWLKDIKRILPEKYQALKDDETNNTQHVKQYHLLKKYSDLLNGQLILDIGTDYGFSALVLGQNRQNKVISFDIEDFNREGKDQIKKEWPNITFVLQNLLEVPDQALVLLKQAKLIYLDIAPHMGIEEVRFYNLIKNSGFKGILLLDDIFLNDGMKNFWNQITERKEDWTSEGHWSGTGIVYF